MTPLGYVAHVEMGQSPPSDVVGDFGDHSIPFLQGNAEFGALHPVPQKSCAAAPKHGAPGSILVSVRAPVGEINMADTLYGIGRGLCAVTPDTARCDARFLWWALRAFTWRLHAVATGSTYAAVSVDDVRALELPVPPLDTQRRIADMLDTETARIDTLIEKNERASQLAQRKLRETIATAVTRGIDVGGERAVDAAWAVAINDAWSWVPYQYYAELGTGHTPSRSDPSLWEDCNVPWVTTADVKHLRSHRREYLDETEHHLSERGLANSAARWLPARTVVLSRTASVGFSAVVTVPTATSQDFFTWTCDEEQLLPEYLLYVLRAMKFRGHFDRLMYGSTHKTIYFPDLVQLRGPLPPVPEQRKIVDHVREQSVGVQSLLERMSRMNELLRLRRQSLITAAVTGQIEV